MDRSTANSQGTTHLISDRYFIVYRAIKTGDYNDVKLLFEDRALVNAPIITTGLFAGFTALHLACMERDWKLFSMLVKDYHADVNVTAEDGVQPIHLVCFFVDAGGECFINLLLDTGVNVDAEFNQAIFKKYAQRHKVPCRDFGDKISILAYCIRNELNSIEPLLKNNADIKIMTLTNRTLLMHTMAEVGDKAAEIVSRYFNDRKLVNHRDNDGKLVTHYLLYPFDDYPKHEREWMGPLRALILQRLILAGVDIYAVINDDPDTLLLNMTAHRRVDAMLQILLPYSTDITQSKALYYSIRPLEFQEINNGFDYQFIPIHLTSTVTNINEIYSLVNFQERRRKCIELVIKDLINRRTFGLAVPESEEELMHQLIQRDASIADIVHNYQQNFIQGLLKNQVLQYGDKSITYYELILMSVDDKRLQVMVRDKNFMDVFKKSYINSDDYKYFKLLLEMRVKKASERVKLLEKLKKVSQLSKAIPLSYELILDIIDFLDNENLDIFIDAFFCI